MNREMMERWRLGWFVALAMLLLAAHLLLVPFACDDAYIHFRVAERFIETGRPFYNIGEAVSASSSPVWTLLLTLVFAITGAAPAAVALLNAICTTLLCVVSTCVVSQLTKQRSLLLDISVTLFVLAIVIVPSVELMETPLALLLLLSGVQRVLVDKPRGFMLLGIAASTRLELAVFPLLFAIHALLRPGARWQRLLVDLLSGAAPFALYQWLFFGALVPQTIRAKQQVYGLGLPEFAANLTEAIYGSILVPYGVLIPRLHVLSVLILGVWAVLVFRRERFALPWQGILLPAGGLLILDAYAVGGVPLFEWYNPLYGVPLAMGVLCAAWGYRGWIGHLVATTAMLPCLATLLQTIGGAFVHESAFPGYEKGLRVQQYLQVGESLRQRYPSAVLASAEIGALGFAFRGKMLDGVGLISPEALRFHPLSIPAERANRFIGAIPSGLVAEAKPELVVGFDPFLRGFLASQERANYREDDLLNLTALPWGTLRVFIRKGEDGEVALPVSRSE